MYFIKTFFCTHLSLISSYVLLIKSSRCISGGSFKNSFLTYVRIHTHYTYERVFVRLQKQETVTLGGKRSELSGKIPEIEGESLQGVTQTMFYKGLFNQRIYMSYRDMKISLSEEVLTSEPQFNKSIDTFEPVHRITETRSQRSTILPLLFLWMNSPENSPPRKQ